MMASYTVKRVLVSVVRKRAVVRLAARTFLNRRFDHALDAGGKDCSVPVRRSSYIAIVRSASDLGPD